jgi:hypothetical protein
MVRSYEFVNANNLAYLFVGILSKGVKFVFALAQSCKKEDRRC